MEEEHWAFIVGGGATLLPIDSRSITFKERTHRSTCLSCCNNNNNDDKSFYSKTPKFTLKKLKTSHAPCKMITEWEIPAGSTGIWCFWEHFEILFCLTAQSSRPQRWCRISHSSPPLSPPSSPSFLPPPTSPLLTPPARFPSREKVHWHQTVALCCFKLQF